MVLGLALFTLPTRADVVVLKSGKKFDVEKVWREKDQVWIIFHGMRASIPPNKIERIESRSNGDSAAPGYEKEKSSPVKSMPGSTPRDVPRRQPQKASQTSLPPQPAKIKRDQSLIFPDEKFGDLRWKTKVFAIKGLEKIQDAGGRTVL